jgi:ACR3 family arsenite efflux pump ArsB
MIWGVLSKISRNLVIAIPTAMLLGFIYGVFRETSFLKGLIIPFTFLMIYPMMVTLKLKKLFEGGDTKAQWLAQLINFGIIPFIAFAVGKLFFSEQPYMALGLLLAALVPTSGMTISWTGFARGNLEAAVKMTVVGLIMGSLATPFYISFLMGARVNVDMVSIMKQIALIVFLPMLAGYGTQLYLLARNGQKIFQERWAPRFPALSTVGVLGIVFIAIAVKADAIAASPQVLLTILTPLLILYAANYLISTIVGKTMLPRGDAVALVYGTVMRNLSIALAVAINTFGPAGSDAALVISAAYVIQVQSAAWYVKRTDRIFGRIPADTQENSVRHRVQGAAR